MNFKTVLVHFDAGLRCTARVDLAIRLAAAHGSHLVGLAPTGGATRHLLDPMTVPTLMSH